MNKYIYLIVSLLCTVALSISTQTVFANTLRNVDIQLWVIHWYSWTLSFIENYYFDGSHFYTSGSSVDLSLGATETSSYTLSANNISVDSWSWTWDYITTLSAPLLWPDWIFNFQAWFTNADNERVQSNILTIEKDTTPPTVVDQLSVQVGQAWENIWIMVSRDPSSDSGAWIGLYTVVFASDETLVSTVQFTTTGASLVIDTILIPDWYTTIQIIAFDNVWNSSRSIPIKFSIQPQVIPPSWSSSSISNWWISPSLNQPQVDEDTNTTWENPWPHTSAPTDQSEKPPILIFQDTNDTWFPQWDPKNTWDRFVITVPFLTDTTSENDSLWDWSSNQWSTLPGTPKDPVLWVRWIWSSPYSWIYICSDDQCVEVKNTWETCSETVCLDIQPQLLHSIATSGQEDMFALLIAYHQDLQRKLSYIKILLYYMLCYDIQLHLRRRNAFFNKIVIIFDK